MRHASGDTSPSAALVLPVDVAGGAAAPLDSTLVSSTPNRQHSLDYLDGGSHSHECSGRGARST